MNGSATAPILTFDVGGTNIRAAVYDPRTDRLRRRLHRRSPSVATMGGVGADGLWRALGAEMVALADALAGPDAPRAIAVAFPAPLDAAGRALASPTLFGQQGLLFPIRQEIERLWPGRPVVVLNDLAAAGYRYVDRFQDFCIVTVGSGIGHKVFLDGHPRVGAQGWGGECGHIVVDRSLDAPVCDCGGRGHLGALASGRGTVNLARWRAAGSPHLFQASAVAASCCGAPERLDSAMLVAGFRAGDAWVTAIVEEAAGLLGSALAGIHLAIGLDRFILVGGFGLALGEAYRSLVAVGARRACWAIGQCWDDMIQFGEMDDDHGLIGAGRRAAALIGEPACAPIGELVA